MKNLSKLSERLQEMLFHKNIKASALAKLLNVSPSTVTRYLREETLPSFDSLVKMLDIFNCSADFLIGLIDFPPENVIYRPIPPFCERFRAIMKERRMSQYALHNKTMLSYDNFNQWLKGNTSPYVDNLIKLAEAFECSVDYLIGHIS